MSAIYDNWERLVAAALKRRQFWELCHAPPTPSRSLSILSEASNCSSRDGLTSSPYDEDSLQFVLFSNFSPAVDVKHVRMASAELLGKGSFGSAYSATMHNGVRIVVKRLKSYGVSELDFKRHIDIVQKVRHANVVPLRGYYASSNERMLLYDYYSEGSVCALLHGKIRGNYAHISWKTRQTIAIGAARAIAEIHRQNGWKLVHGNIKASNIFLSSNLSCCVSDLGLANMIEKAFMPISWCSAPEVKNTNDISQASDVYSFGILLLELLTRKSSVHVPGGLEAVDLVKLVGSVKTMWRAAKVFDADLLQYPTIKKDMVHMLKIALKCVAKSVKKRPKMSEVVKMLEDIVIINQRSHVSGNEGLVFLEDRVPTFDREDIFSEMPEVIGKGTFGNSYVVTSRNSEKIVVKRLKGIVFTLELFHQYMKLFGTMKHENVARIRAFHFSGVEKLVIYHYYSQNSVSTLLHGKRSIGEMPLDWKTRLKIAVGAARGVAHIHQHNGGKLAHGNIRSSNIFVDGQKHGIVSEAGLTKLTNPVRRPARWHPRDYPPEVTDTWRVSQASDVYSFGVFLLELASGRITEDNESRSLVEWFQSIPRAEWVEWVFDMDLSRNLNKAEEEAMVQFLRIAMDCIIVDLPSRPRMAQVVKMLEEIGGATILSAETKLEDLMEDLLHKLTP